MGYVNQLTIDGLSDNTDKNNRSESVFLCQTIWHVIQWKTAGNVKSLGVTIFYKNIVYFVTVPSFSLTSNRAPEKKQWKSGKVLSLCWTSEPQISFSFSLSEMVLYMFSNSNKTLSTATAWRQCRHCICADCSWKMMILEAIFLKCLLDFGSSIYLSQFTNFGSNSVHGYYLYTPLLAPYMCGINSQLKMVTCF